LICGILLTARWINYKNCNLFVSGICLWGCILELMFPESLSWTLSLWNCWYLCLDSSTVSDLSWFNSEAKLEYFVFLILWLPQMWSTQHISSVLSLSLKIRDVESRSALSKQQEQIPLSSLSFKVISMFSTTRDVLNVSCAVNGILSSFL
jgi:hypothetical protein